MGLSFFRPESGRNTTNPAIWLVPGAGGIFSYGPLQRAESVEFIYFLERISGFFPFYTSINDLSTQLYFYSPLDGKESRRK